MTYETIQQKDVYFPSEINLKKNHLATVWKKQTNSLYFSYTHF